MFTAHDKNISMINYTFYLPKKLGVKFGIESLLTSCRGNSAISFDCNLNVFPCAKLRIKIGNLNRSSLDKILKKNSLRKIVERNNFKEPCGNCKYINLCGGCRAEAYYKKPNNILGGNDNCFIN